MARIEDENEDPPSLKLPAYAKSYGGQAGGQADPSGNAGGPVFGALRRGNPSSLKLRRGNPPSLKLRRGKGEGGRVCLGVGGRHVVTSLILPGIFSKRAVTKPLQGVTGRNGRTTKPGVVPAVVEIWRWFSNFI
jgi:hypothetical protein